MPRMVLTERDLDSSVFNAQLEAVRDALTFDDTTTFTGAHLSTLISTWWDTVVNPSAGASEAGQFFFAQGRVASVTHALTGQAYQFEWWVGGSYGDVPFSTALALEITNGRLPAGRYILNMIKEDPRNFVGGFSDDTAPPLPTQTQLDAGFNVNTFD